MAIKSISLPDAVINKVNNYIGQNNGNFSNIVEKGLDLFFEALENGNNKYIETLGLEDPEHSILVPFPIYLTMNQITYVQLQGLIKSKKIVTKTFNETSPNGVVNSKSQYVIITKDNPEFFKAKAALNDKKVDELSSNFDKLSESLNNHINKYTVKAKEVDKLSREIEKLKEQLKNNPKVKKA